MNILEDLPYEIEYIEPKNYLNEFVFSDIYNDLSNGMMNFLNKFMDANEKELFEYNEENNIIKSEFIKFIINIKKKCVNND